MKNSFCFFFIFIPFCIAAQVNTRGVIVTADSSRPAGTTYAIVIGISQYKEVTPLIYADRDARVFADFLLNKKGGGLDSANVKVFLNSTATINSIGNALSDIILKKLHKGDRVIFFFAGHGDYDANILKDQALLLLYGAPKKDYFQNIFSGDFISTADLNSRFIEPLQNRDCEVMLIIDACHATGMNKSLSGGAEGGKITMQALQNMTSPVKIYSCRANEFSLESEQWGGGRGLFSYELMEGLYGMADLDHDKVVTLRELQRYLEDNVPKMAAPNKQNPVIKIDDADQAVARVDDDFLALYKTQKDKSLVFISRAEIKGSSELWIQEMDSVQRKIYQECERFIEKKELDKAYATFQLFAKTDSISDASLQLRRNLSAALQEKAAFVLTPMLEDISKFKSSDSGVAQAERDLVKAAILLGENHFLYKNLQARILFLRGELKSWQNDNDGAILLFEQSAKLEANAPYTYFELALCYQILNNFEKSSLNYDKYLNLIPNSFWAYNNLGLMCEDMERYPEAIKYFKKALELHPDDQDIYNDMGLAYAELKQYDEAIKSFKKAIEIDPNPDEYANLGSLYDDLKMTDEAIKCYKYVIKANPNDTVILTNLAMIYMNRKNYDPAIAIFKRVAPLKSESGGTYYNLACIYSLKKKPDTALVYFEKALQKDYKNLANMASDTDINNIRTLPKFKELMNQYFTREEMEKYPGFYSMKK